jgi:hypothetical protein
MVGYSIVDAWDWTAVGVITTNVVENRQTGQTGTVTVVGTNLTADIQFSPGDPYIITLTTPYTVASSEEPVYELVCKMCGFQCKKKELDTYQGRCKVCFDPDPPKKVT